VLAVSGLGLGRTVFWARDYVSTLLIGTLTSGATRLGVGGVYDGSEGTAFVKGGNVFANLVGSERITLVTTARPSSVSNEIRALGFGNDGGSSLFNLQIAGGGAWRLQIRNDAGTLDSVSGVTPVVGRADVVVGRVSGFGGEMSIFSSGGKTTGTCPSGPITINRVSVGFLDRNAGSIVEQGWTGWLGEQLVFSQDLTDAECCELQSNPFSVYEPRRIWIPTSAAAPSSPILSGATVFDITATTARPRVTVTF
jgi:hypothetical protein